ncbi:MAG: SulP family inorganic anion transporter [Myxococcales bacterium]|nr:SulP family inorganic anion transporter [Myxococcales bacterium]
MDQRKFLAFLDLKSYKRSAFLRDITSAWVVTFLGIPQGIAYAVIAGLPPAMGLYASTFPSIVGSLFRSSRHVVTGPTNAVSLLVGGGVLAMQGVDPVVLGVTLAFLVGLLQLSAGLFRLGAIVDYISSPVVLGYITGAALLIGIGQLPVVTATSSGHGSLFEKLWTWILGLQHASLTAILMALASACLLLVLRRANKNIPGALILTVLATGVSLFFDLRAHGMMTVMDLRPIPRGFPPLSLPDLALLTKLLPLAVACAVLSLVESSAVGRALAAQSGQRLEMSTEFAGQGLANIVAAVSSGYPTSGSPSRSALNLKSGAETRLSAALSGVFMLVVLVLLGPLANAMPLAALAGLILVVAIDLIDLRKIRTVMRSGFSDRAAFLATLFGTWVMPLDQAIYLGVGISLLLFLRKARFLVITPITVDEQRRFAENCEEHQPFCRSIRVLDIEGRLFFGVEGELQLALDEVLEDPQIRVLLLRLKRTQGLDITVANLLQATAERLRREGRTLVLAGLRQDALQLLRTVGILEDIGEENVFASQSQWFAAMDKALQHACELVAREGCEDCPLHTYLQNDSREPPQTTH